MADDGKGGAFNAALPLKDAVLCCTALAQDVRTKLGETATQMGATHKLDLTADVTHLLVGSIDTPKYAYVAKERPDIKVLRPEWIEAVRLAWMEGGDVDMPALEAEHRLPTFFNLKVCVTGFDQHEQRSYIARTLETGGAEYHGDLTRQVTHLIAAAPQGAKYSHGKQWGIAVVSLRWFEDSLKRGMTLDASLYDPSVPREEQGRGAFREAMPRRTSLGKRTREGGSQGPEDAGKRKLRRTASTRLHSQSQDLWQDLSTRDDGAETPRTDQWEDGDAQEAVTNRENADITTAATKPSAASELLVDRTSDDIGPDKLFTGRAVLIHGFDRAKFERLVQFLEPNGASIVASVPDLEAASQNGTFKSRHLLVPRETPREGLVLPTVPVDTELVTEWWIERCVNHKRYLAPSEDPLSRPPWNAKKPDFRSLSICTTGFSSVDFRQIVHSVKLMGATYDETLLSSTSVLISGAPSVKNGKAFYAAKHAIPVVSVDWLWQSIDKAKREPFLEYTLRLPNIHLEDAAQGSPAAASPAPTEPLPRRLDGSSKTKRDSSAPKRLSNTRKRHPTPSLALLTSRPKSLPPAQRHQPFVHEDADDDDVVNAFMAGDAARSTATPPRSQPLQELSPNKSPRKLSQKGYDGQCDSRTDEPSKPTPPPTSQPLSERRPSPSRPEHDLTADLATLLHRQIASRSDPSPSDLILQKRKHRPLGRSASGLGQRSLSASVRSQSVSRSLDADHAASDFAADGYAPPSRGTEHAPPPGTQLGYETAEAEAHRLQMSKTMGVVWEDPAAGTRVASIGTVKDGGGGGAQGARARGRARNR